MEETTEGTTPEPGQWAPATDGRGQLTGHIRIHLPASHSARFQEYAELIATKAVGIEGEWRDLSLTNPSTAAHGLTRAWGAPSAPPSGVPPRA